MKKLLFTLLLSVATITSAMAQEWLTSLTLAKKLALSKNKMLLVIWEDSANYSYPIILEDADGTKVVTELFESDAVKTLVWKYFVPVIINESMYQQLFDKIDGKRNMSYINRFNDDNVKVMDPNGNILDLRTADEFMTQDLTAIIKKYALDTSFLEAELNSYFENKNYATTFRLANKYLDFAIYAEDFVKEEIIMLSDIYMLEAENLLQNSDYATKEALLQKHELLKIKEALILGKDNKARRMLKKYTEEDIDKINVALFAFLNYATYRSLDNIEEALPWKAQVLQSDLNKVKFIVNK
ncbi:hypothetical protein [Olleya namhaensis]|uniref:Uncharacterized protein n=1 Tax=Olleya namhaensis TaxID=1144750 RepID=A0A1I3RST0_9FLAO|nr:hypothetical protein [Olleya namhaensis]SFJ48337.1 hypothetical protein SAMN05443431_10889 [Olleya namhaensis]